MKRLTILLLLITLCGCGEMRGQLYKITSPDEVETANYYCTTVIGIPVLCGVHVHTETTIRIIDIVTEVVERIVEIEVEKIVEVPIETITREVFVIYRDKDVDLEVIIAEVIRRVKQALPPAQIRQDIDVPIVVAEVSQAVIESTPYVETGEVEKRTRTKTDNQRPVVESEVLTPPVVIPEPQPPTPEPVTPLPQPQPPEPVTPVVIPQPPVVDNTPPPVKPPPPVVVPPPPVTTSPRTTLEKQTASGDWVSIGTADANGQWDITEHESLDGEYRHNGSIKTIEELSELDLIFKNE